MTNSAHTEENSKMTPWRDMDDVELGKMVRRMATDIERYAHEKEITTLQACILFISDFASNANHGNMKFSWRVSRFSKHNVMLGDWQVTVNRIRPAVGRNIV